MMRSVPGQHAHAGFAIAPITRFDFSAYGWLASIRAVQSCTAYRPLWSAALLMT